MPAQQVLVMAMTRMTTGICTAGFTTQKDPVSRLRWIRPIKEYGTILLGDLTDSHGRVIQLYDVIELQARQPRPDPPHGEDWITDFIYHRPRLLRRLEGERRARFLAAHLDQAPRDVLGREPKRSLCLVRPARLWAHFGPDPRSLQYQARIGFTLPGLPHPRANSSRGVPVTDLKWRALGRRLLGQSKDTIALDQSALREKLAAQEIYLSLGLSRGYQGKLWLLVVGVHVVPEYQVEVDYDNL
jgi:hypothetical protein